MRLNVSRNLDRVITMQIFFQYIYVQICVKRYMYAHVKNAIKLAILQKFRSNFEKFFSIYIFSQFLVEILMILCKKLTRLLSEKPDCCIVDE